MVALDVHGMNIPIGVGGDARVALTAPPQYVLPNCAGDPVLRILVTAPDPLFPPVVLGGPGNTLYVPDMSAVARLTAVSRRFFGGDCLPDNDAERFAPAVPLVNLDDLYRPPFTVR